MDTHRNCFYCGKPYQPGDVITSDENENGCHVDCDDPKLEKKDM